MFPVFCMLYQSLLMHQKYQRHQRHRSLVGHCTTWPWDEFLLFTRIGATLGWPVHISAQIKLWTGARELHMTCLFRKTWYGRMFKTLCDGDICIMFLAESKESRKEYWDIARAFAATTLRLTKYWADTGGRLVAVAWFGSFSTAGARWREILRGMSSYASSVRLWYTSSVSPVLRRGLQRQSMMARTYRRNLCTTSTTLSAPVVTYACTTSSDVAWHFTTQVSLPENQRVPAMRGTFWRCMKS